MDNKLYVSSSPHIRSDVSIKKVMWTVNISLVPAIIVSYLFFGLWAIILILISVMTALVSEYIVQKVLKKQITISDGSAVITGILLAFNIPSHSPWYVPVIGTVVAIVIAKHFFGGLGFNIFNPALIGRAFLLSAYPVIITGGFMAPQYTDAYQEYLQFKSQPQKEVKVYRFQYDVSTLTKQDVSEIKAKAGQDELLLKEIDAVASATPLHALKIAKEDKLDKSIETTLVRKQNLWKLFIGKRGGCLGENSILALLIGAIILLYFGYITWHIPVVYILTVFIFTFIYEFFTDQIFMIPVFHILSGGLILGAFFMATDIVTSPITSTGKIIFAIGCGFLTSVIRIWGGYPEGVSYSILVMNSVVPLIDKFTRRKIFGYKKEVRAS